MEEKERSTMISFMLFCKAYARSFGFETWDGLDL